MTPEERQELLYNRQYIISPISLNPFKGWLSNKIGDLHIYTHPNLEVTVNEDGNVSIVLLGYMFDATNPTYNDAKILSELKGNSFKDVLIASSRYGGRFLIIYQDEKEIKLFHDPAGLREVFYLKSKGLWLASQPSLLQEFLDIKKGKNDFYSSGQFEGRKERILGTSQYENLKHLNPNYYLDLKTGISKRYFPTESIRIRPIEDVAKECVTYLKGFVEAANQRSKLMIAVTGGWDSRMMLAASLDLGNVYYFIFKHGYMNDDDLDLRIPRKLLKLLKLNFDIIEYKDQIDLEAYELMIKSVELGRIKSNPPFYNVFYKKFRNYLNITCVSEAARNYFHYQADPNKVTGKTLAELNKFPGIEFVENTYQKWIDENAHVFKENGYNILDMFYWEEKMGNWLANGRSSMANVIEDFSPFNCRNLMTLFLSVDEKYRDRYNPILHKKIIEHLSKDALKIPVNGSFKYLIIKWLVIFKIYPIYKRIQLALKAN